VVAVRKRSGRPTHEYTQGFGLPAKLPRPPEHRHIEVRRLWQRSRRTLAVAVPAAGIAVVVAGGWLIPLIRATGRFLQFYAGVFALVTLTLSVVVGLAATDRLVLAPRHRVRAQAIHRALAFAAVAGLTAHVATQVAGSRIRVIDAVLPLQTVEIGLGTIACYLLIALTASGIARGRFAVGSRPWLWRLLHRTAYVAWPLAIAHGLTSGRTPAAWVTSSYGLCLGAVAAALLVRVLSQAGSRRVR
jgi:DMSO/TMAO reductase YedYZ heme-binding membrane subunit